jgi:hypothetical protein
MCFEGALSIKLRLLNPCRDLPGESCVTYSARMDQGPLNQNLNTWRRCDGFDSYASGEGET